MGSNPQLAGSISNVTGICYGLTGPEAGTRNVTTHTGSTVLMYAGLAQSGGGHAYMELFDFSATAPTISSTLTLSYWIYPQSTATNPWETGSNSTCVAIDLFFSDGTNLHDSGSVDQHGNRAHPAYQYQHLTLDTWNPVTVTLGTHCAGKHLIRIDTMSCHSVVVCFPARRRTQHQSSTRFYNCMTRRPTTWATIRQAARVVIAAISMISRSPAKARFSLVFWR